MLGKKMNEITIRQFYEQNQDFHFRGQGLCLELHDLKAAFDATNFQLL